MCSGDPDALGPDRPATGCARAPSWLSALVSIDGVRDLDDRGLLSGGDVGTLASRPMGSCSRLRRGDSESLGSCALVAKAPGSGGLDD